MSRTLATASPRALSRLAGVFYLMIIMFGILAEVGVRARMFVEGDPAGTAARIAASPGLLRIGFAADVIMIVCDVAVAVLLYVLLKPAGPVLSMSAMFFRLTQAVVLGVNLLHFHAGSLVLGGGPYAAAFTPEQAQGLSYLFLDLHRHGYDLGLIFFGVHCVLLGVLIARSGFLPRALGLLVGTAGVVYLVGSGARFLFPEALGAVSPLYVVAFVSELSLCLWLLVKGIDPDAQRSRPEAAPATSDRPSWNEAEARHPADEEIDADCRHCGGKILHNQLVKQCPECGVVLHSPCYRDTEGGRAYATPDCESCRHRCYWR